MKKLGVLVICVILIGSVSTWYVIIRPSNIRKDCAFRNRDLSNTHIRITRKNIDKYLMNAMDSAAIPYDQDNAWQDLQDTSTMVYTGEYDTAYNTCLHQRGL